MQRLERSFEKNGYPTLDLALNKAWEQRVTNTKNLFFDILAFLREILQNIHILIIIYGEFLKKPTKL